MPDWSYRTLFQPVLFRLPPARARDLCLGFLHVLGRVPGGLRVVDFLGHTRPDPRLARPVMGREFCGPTGLSCVVDPGGKALRAFERFGFSFVEVGPVVIGPSRQQEAIRRVAGQRAIGFPTGGPAVALDEIAPRLDQRKPGGLPVFIRLAGCTGGSPQEVTGACRRIVERLGAAAAGFTLDTADRASGSQWTMDEWREHVAAVAAAVRRASPRARLVLCLHSDENPAAVDRLIESLPEGAVDGLFVDGSVATDEGRLYGPVAREESLGMVRHLRQQVGTRLAIVAGGVQQPAEALELLEAGADLLAVDSGLVFAGPGLPKRINEAVLSRCRQRGADAVADSRPYVQHTWFWTLLMGLAMLVGGVMALVIAVTRVVLPYDEALVGMSREEIASVNERLLAFMQHDRATLAGTMLSVGILYTALSLTSLRRGEHWARVAILASAFSGFGTFFLFLGFGYFDPFHAFVTAVLFQFLLLALSCGPELSALPTKVNVREDLAWRLGLWGQLLFVLHGGVLILAGAIISVVGITTVFVPEDLWFLQTTPEAIAAANPHLIPLIAHDRATFGGMLIACGLVVLLAALWGWQQGNRWLWGALVAGGSIAYLTTVWVHLSVGYDHFGHLLPAYAGLMWLWAGGALSYAYLVRG